jgi:hypothetical protein
VSASVSEQEFVDAALAELEPDTGELYTRAMPIEQSFAGLRRYVDKRAEAA